MDASAIPLSVLLSEEVGDCTLQVLFRCGVSTT